MGKITGEAGLAAAGLGPGQFHTRLHLATPRGHVSHSLCPSSVVIPTNPGTRHVSANCRHGGASKREEIGTILWKAPQRGQEPPSLV